MQNDKEDEHTSGSTRRSLLKRIGATAGVAAAPISVSAVGSASPPEGQNNGGDQAKMGEGTSSEAGYLQPQFMTGSKASFRPYNIVDGESSILRAKWSFGGVLPVSVYQFDIIIEYNNLYEPVTVGTDIPSQDIEKDWVKAYNAPVGNGDVWYWKANSSAIDVFGDDCYLDVEVTPIASGEITAKVGSYWPTQMWARATLDVDPL